MSRKLALAVAVAAQLVAATASAAPPVSVIGNWSILGNQSFGQLIVTAQGAAGTCRAIVGTAFANPMQGFYCPSTGRIQFLRKNPANNDTIQIYTGNVGDFVAGLPMRMAGTFTSQNTAIGGALGEYNFFANK
jgi:hypothetical protein